MSNPAFVIQRAATGKIRVTFRRDDEDRIGYDWTRRKVVQESSVKNSDGSLMCLMSETYMDTSAFLEPEQLTEQEKIIAAYIILTYG